MRTRLIHIAGHVAGWLFFFSIVIGFFANGLDSNDQSAWHMLYSPSFIVFGLVFLFLFYFNFFFVTPKLFLAKRYLLYAVVSVALLVAVYFIQPFDRLMSLTPPPREMGWPADRKPGPPPPGNMPRMGPVRRQVDINSIIMFVTIWSLSTAIPVARRWRTAEQRVLQAEADRANAELSILKSQVNPHFLFNTLNNIYSLAVTKNDNTGPAIMKLSNIMRYVTDEVQADFVPLDSEISCMNDFIDLQRMRLGEKMQVNLSVTGTMIDKKISPLILMTFTENVFKYGVSSHESSAITIKLKADEHNITFFCQNRIFEGRKQETRKGTGILNARKRLEHLYPNKHFLDINTANNLFTVQLNLQA